MRVFKKHMHNKQDKAKVVLNLSKLSYTALNFVVKYANF